MDDFIALLSIPFLHVQHNPQSYDANIETIKLPYIFYVWQLVADELFAIMITDYCYSYGLLLPFALVEQTPHLLEID